MIIEMCLLNSKTQFLYYLLLFNLNIFWVGVNFLHYTSTRGVISCHAVQVMLICVSLCLSLSIYFSTLILLDHQLFLGLLFKSNKFKIVGVEIFSHFGQDKVKSFMYWKYEC